MSSGMVFAHHQMLLGW